MKLIDAEGLINHLTEMYCENCKREFGSIWCYCHCALFKSIKEIEDYADKNSICKNELRFMSLN